MWLVSLALAANPRVELIDLSGPWEVATPEEAARGAWSEAILPDRYVPPPPGGGTRQDYRRTITFPPGEGPPVGLTLGFGTAAYEVWVDGVKLGGMGNIGESGPLAMGALRQGVYDVPDALLADGRLDIELRLGLLPGRTTNRFGRGTHALGPAAAVQAAAKAADLDYMFRKRAPHALGGVLLALAASWHVLLWVRRRDQDAAGVFGLLALSLAVWELTLFVHRSNWSTITLGTAVLLGLALTSAFVVAVEFNARFHDGRPPGRRARVLQAVGATVLLVPVAYALGTGQEIPGRLFESLGLFGWFVVLVAGALHGAWRRKPDSAVLAVGFGLALAAMITVFFVFPDLERWLDLFLVATVVVLLGTIALAVGNAYIRRIEAVEATRAAAMRFVPVDFLHALGADDITQVQRGDARATHLTVMFTDIRGFTTRSERYTAEENFAFVNAYLARMEPCIHDNGGFVNQYLGDGVMALFPSADGAVRAALAMQEEVRRFGNDIGEEVRIGIGMNTGRVMLGTIGGLERIDATIVSATQNLAARVEGMTKTYGVDVLLTEHTRRALEHAWDLRELDWVVAKGSDEKLAIYDVVAPSSAWRDALTAFRGGDLRAARAAFEALGDAPARLFVARCDALLAEGLPADWDGVTRLTVK